MPMQLNEVFDYNDMEKIDEYWIKYEGCFWYNLTKCLIIIVMIQRKEWEHYI